MREYLQKKNRVLTDFEKATLIWNLPGISWRERIKALQELEKETTDSVLRQQIQDRLQYELAEYEDFLKIEPGKYVYTVEDEHRELYGVFADFDAAYEYVLYCLEEFKEFNVRCFFLKKNLICTKETLEEYKESYGHEYACMEIDAKGDIAYFWSSGVFTHEEDYKERFEDHFFRIPCGLPTGCVKVVGLDSYGVVKNSEEAWEAFMDRWSDSGAVDYMDLSVTVCFLTENGLWSHEHINPLLLEPDMPSPKPGDVKEKAHVEAIKALTRYWENESIANAAEVLLTASQYAIECGAEKIVMVEDIEDIFC